MKIWQIGIVVGGVAIISFFAWWFTMTPKNPSVNLDESKGQSDARMQQFGFIRGVIQNGSSTSIAFDDARWLMGMEGEEAAIRAGICTKETREECLPNDFFIENTATATTALAVSDAAHVYLTTYKTGEPDDGPEEVSVSDFAELINDPQTPWRMLPFRLSIAGGEVVIIEEQYVP